MDRQIIYSGQVPQTLDILNTNKNTMLAIAKMAADVFGTSTIATGLACVPTVPATMSVNVNPGQIYQNVVVDQTAYSDIALDTSHSIVKSGILMDAQNFAITAPGTAGFSQNYLIQAAFLETDTDNSVLPYYNSANPSQALNGPGGSGGTQSTRRAGKVSLQLLAGAAAATGTQKTPAVTDGYIGLWVITVANGQSTITAGNIVAYNGAPLLQSPILTQVQQSPSVVGTARNLVMSVAAASTTAQLTADEIVVESALGGNTYKLASFGKTINLATTGAGGMDTGSAPASGFVAIYAIYNPTTQTAALLAKNATSAVQPNVYGGANMPAGYTASALVSVWPTDGTGKLVVGYQRARTISINSVTVLTSSTPQASPTALSVSSAIPPNAVGVSGTFAVASSAAATTSLQLNPIASANVGIQGINYSSTSASGGGSSAAFRNLQISTAQTIYYTSSNSAGTPTYNVVIMGYDF